MGQRIAIVDDGMGNLRSVEKALAHVAPSASVAITSDPAVIRAADRVVFRGQGAMPDCMRCLSETGWGKRYGKRQPPSRSSDSAIGLQMLFEHSAEGDTPGLAIPSRSRAGECKDCYAVIIGSSKYRSVPEVKYAAKDAEMVAKYVENLRGIPRTNIKLITNESCDQGRHRKLHRGVAARGRIHHGPGQHGGDPL